MSINALTRPVLPPLEDFIPYLEDIWARKQITNKGYYHECLEEALSNYLGVPFISLCANGTLALMLALKALNIQGEVITTPYSFIATSNVLHWSNIAPVFVDVDPHTCNIDPEKITSAITSRTTAIMPVHVYGMPCNHKAIQEIANKFNLKIIYDAAHAFGVKENGVSVLHLGDLSVISLHATKVYSTIEGGAVICHTKSMKDKLDQLRNFGFGNGCSINFPGINAKLNEIQSAFGLAALNYVDTVIHKRKMISAIYNQAMEPIAGIRTMKERENIVFNYTYYPVFIDKNEFGMSRDELFVKLQSHGILTKKYFSPLISEMEPYCQQPSARRENLPVAHRLSEEVLCLPMHQELTERDIYTIVENLKK